MATMNNTKKEEKVYGVLTRYGITDRRVAITAKGVMVYVPAGCLGERYTSMYDDIKRALSDGSEVVVFHAKDSLSVKEFIKNNIALLKEKDLI
ncbi:MAG: hypothetical protein Q4D28_08490 [Prevotellaceae bacterium]|nr:hypothetical protein [Prevotellaceae bacterium]